MTLTLICLIMSHRKPFGILKSRVLSDKLFLFWRGFASVYLVGIVIATIAANVYYNALRIRLFTEITHWSLCLSTMYLIVAWISMVYCKNNNFAHDVLSKLQNLSCSLSIVVVLSYWLFIGNPDNVIVSVHKHGVSAVLTVTDLLLCANAIPLGRALVQNVALSVVYSMFNFVLHTGFGVQVYPRQMNWKAAPFPVKAVVFAFANMIANVLVLIGLYWLVRLLHNHTVTSVHNNTIDNNENQRISMQIKQRPAANV
eukprot:257305_1